ncbi:MAG: hypothetical protein JNK45_08345 [Myxococcales bacterium]|nr:hypothetical protein [Myxococcales bacterium]
MTELGDHDTRVAAATAARREAFGKLGIVDRDVLAPMIGPALLGGSRWPTRPAWRVIHRDGRTAIASDALSDPWDDEFGVGFGLEFWIEADVPVPVAIGSWLMAAIHDVSYTAAGHGGVRRMLDELGTISIEIAGRPFPPALRNEHGRVGVLLGVPCDLPTWLTLPEGRARLVPITLLTASELAHVVAHGDAGRIEVARRLAAAATGMRSDPGRVGVV